MKHLWTCWLILLCVSCRDTVYIDRHRIYNTGWANGMYQGFYIAKITFEDTNSMSIDNPNFNHFNLDSRIIDSTFCFGVRHVATFDDEGYQDEIYFDKKTEHVEWYKCNDIVTSYDSIGLLKPNTWYLIYGMGGTEEFFIYVGGDGKSHVYSTGPTNW